MSNTLDYSRLRTPPSDGDVLIEPPMREWAALLQANRAAQAAQHILLAGHDVHAVRRQTRAAMPGRGNLSGNAGRDGGAEATPADEPVVIACGHQPAFVHPGVWAKHVVVRAASQALGVAGLDLVVDNDAPADADLILPVVKDGRVETRRVAASQGPAGSAYEGRAALSAARLAEIRTAAGHAALNGKAMLEAYLTGCEAATGTARDFVDQHLAGRQRVDEPLGAILHEARVSQYFGGPFVADLLLNAERFREAYNSALRIYRQREQVRSPDRPLPDLGRDGGRIEAALWLYRPLERRRRMWVEPIDGRLRLYADQQAVGELTAEELAADADAALARLRPWVVRPRALTLTLWARLLVCDLFVHGIGGAKYDRVTDEIFRGYYQITPPYMACVSATLRLELPRFPVSAGDLAAAERRLRDLLFNPQRYVATPPADLMEQRQRLIEASQRLRAQRGDRLERRRVYLAIRETNAALLAGEPDLRERMAREVERLRSELASNAVAGSREFFYALQPAERLKMLAQRLVNDS